MRRLLGYIYLILMSAVAVWLIANAPSIILGISGLIVCIAIIGGIATMCFYIQDAWNDFLDRQRLQRLLGNMTLEEVLEKSPYEYSHW